MSARLIDFCKWANEKTDAISSLVSFPGKPLEKNLKESLNSLKGRLRHPEVRLLILGPLKSGKSTLMNVICEHPSISQVNPLPAYPCTVEVRDIERDLNLHPIEKENCTFYKQSQPTKSMPLEEGMKTLNNLLDDFIQRPGDIETRFDKVIQKINLLPKKNMPPENRYTVLVDSPGLFFSKKSYSMDVEKEYAEADVVIFVVRQEQLFFESVNEYLVKFTSEAVHRRGFILVNIAVPDPKDMDQSSQEIYQKKLDTYFRRHIATPELNQELINDDRISIRFANLFLAYEALIEKKGEFEQTFQNSETAKSLATIRKYLQTKLVDEKIKDISKKFTLTAREAEQFLKKLLDEEEADIQTLQHAVDKLQLEIQSKEELKQGVEQEKKGSRDKIAQNERRLELLQTDFDPDDFSSTDPDPLIKQLKSAFNALPLSSDHWMEQSELRELVEKSYMKWQSGAHGNRTFNNLIKIIWQTDVEDDNLSLTQYYQKLFTHTYKDCVARLKYNFSDELLRLAAGDSDTDEYINTAINLNSQKGDPKYLMFKPRGFWIWRKTPETFWGEYGDRIVDEEDEELLHFEADRFIGQIIQDWDILELFSAENLQSLAKESLKRTFMLNLRSLIERQNQSEEALTQKLNHRTTRLDLDIASLTHEKTRVQNDLDHHQKNIDSLKNRLKELKLTLRSFDDDIHQFTHIH